MARVRKKRKTTKAVYTTTTKENTRKMYAFLRRHAQWARDRAILELRR